ncbi:MULTISPECIES: DnaB-like helicase N-terminal domain-containing protein [Streptomyces]|uniref:DnaB-like helicase N-terminal domain-containing protein n=1 Tax=Streptomyces doudnae TaxID=3075536 RepID=A0ABD5EVL1_9ACTN|nr:MULTISPECIES: DnaB-like helicase N-terminal domain-containing protein [unclassified Streptomyces]MDT0438688.1 DnaB-like helicase N-terminal domain-containing protein [Streptomyces sp. DSM 41981]MYQ69120.1 replicative DNA helicase [Streptomyces sp. SID4950]SCE51576.1 DnaB-like helicase N terminal domain-containing protein [Streptomyces sp. SolWspMP-5a-2]
MSPTPTPEPDKDELNAVPPPQPVFHVEQALLGALLRDPRLLDEVSGIAADSFSTAAHAALYAAISTVPRPDPAEHAKNTKWLDRVRATALKEARGLDATYLHTLIQVCPWHRHAPAYARMIEAERARRRLLTAAESLMHTVHDASLPLPVQTVLTEADALATVVDDIANRFPPRSGVLPRTAAPPSVRTPDPTEAVEEEKLLLATATARPADIESIRWLIPADLTLPLHAGLWQCLTTLARRNEPVDPVTVLWEAQQRGLLDDGSEPGDVLRMLAEPAGFVEHWAERALQRSLLATAEHTARRIEAYADDPANTPFQLVVGARRALADIDAVRTRWQNATQATPPQQQRPAPAIRAGPPTTTSAHAARSTRATR